MKTFFNVFQKFRTQKHGSSVDSFKKIVISGLQKGFSEKNAEKITDSIQAAREATEAGFNSEVKIMHSKMENMHLKIDAMNENIRRISGQNDKLLIGLMIAMLMFIFKEHRMRKKKEDDESYHHNT